MCSHEPFGPGIAYKYGNVWVGPAVCKKCGGMFAAKWADTPKDNLNIGEYLGVWHPYAHDEE